MKRSNLLVGVAALLALGAVSAARAADVSSLDISGFVTAKADHQQLAVGIDDKNIAQVTATKPALKGKDASMIAQVGDASNSISLDTKGLSAAGVASLISGVGSTMQVAGSYQSANQAQLTATAPQLTGDNTTVAAVATGVSNSYSVGRSK